MADDQKYGTSWQADELDVIIADYFAMLNADIEGHSYVKSKHNAAVMVQTGRSHRSVEFKYQNISAVLEELGLPWIPGYKPKANYQKSIFDGIDRYLSDHPRILDLVPIQPVQSIVTSGIFVSPPVPTPLPQELPKELRRLIHKFDPVERDHRNRKLGRAGEQFILEFERKSLQERDRTDLASRVRWVADEDGDGAGYDILSFDTAGRERLIEVKTTNGGARTPFFLSRNELDLSFERPTDWRIYRVHLFAASPRVFTLSPPLDTMIGLTPEVWRASFQIAAVNARAN